MSIHINKKNKTVDIDIPLTTTSGKIRVKTRSNIFEYGQPHASRQVKFTLYNYIEWQIGYDVIVKEPEKLALSTLQSCQFTAYNGKVKALYELSEYLFYFKKFNLIKETDLLLLKSFLESIDNNYIENTSQIKRTHPKDKIINSVLFYESMVEYPLLVYKFLNYEIIAEIIVREKQRAIGTQAMLYFCIPITELKENHTLIGRTANKKELAHFSLNENNFQIILEMVKIFGMLSKSHCTDILAIIDLILNHKN